jgi:hypothetical protein
MPDYLQRITLGARWPIEWKHPVATAHGSVVERRFSVVAQTLD